MRIQFSYSGPFGGKGWDGPSDGFLLLLMGVSFIASFLGMFALWGLTAYWFTYWWGLLGLLLALIFPPIAAVLPIVHLPLEGFSFFVWLVWGLGTWTLHLMLMGLLPRLLPNEEDIIEMSLPEDPPENPQVVELHRQPDDGGTPRFGPS